MELSSPDRPGASFLVPLLESSESVSQSVSQSVSCHLSLSLTDD
jgi:hypothetical protein